MPNKNQRTSKDQSSARISETTRTRPEAPTTKSSTTPAPAPRPSTTQQGSSSAKSGCSEQSSSSGPSGPQNLEQNKKKDYVPPELRKVAKPGLPASMPKKKQCTFTYETQTPLMPLLLMDQNNLDYVDVQETRRKRRSYTDLGLCSKEGTIVWVHRPILLLGSPFIRRILEHEGTTLIHLEDYDVHTVKTVCTLFYTGQALLKSSDDYSQIIQLLQVLGIPQASLNVASIPNNQVPHLNSVLVAHQDLLKDPKNPTVSSQTPSIHITTEREVPQISPDPLPPTSPLPESFAPTSSRPLTSASPGSCVPASNTPLTSPGSFASNFSSPPTTQCLESSPPTTISPQTSPSTGSSAPASSSIQTTPIYFDPFKSNTSSASANNQETGLGQSPTEVVLAPQTKKRFSVDSNSSNERTNPRKRKRVDTRPDNTRTAGFGILTRNQKKNFGEKDEDRDPERREDFRLAEDLLLKDAEAKKYTCPACQSGCRTKGEILKHMQECASAESMRGNFRLNPKQCLVCNQQFKNLNCDRFLSHVLLCQPSGLSVESSEGPDLTQPPVAQVGHKIQSGRNQVPRSEASSQVSDTKNEDTTPSTPPRVSTLRMRFKNGNYDYGRLINKSTGAVSPKYVSISLRSRPQVRPLEKANDFTTDESKNNLKQKSTSASSRKSGPASKTGRPKYNAHSGNMDTEPNPTNENEAIVKSGPVPPQIQNSGSNGPLSKEGEKHVTLSLPVPESNRIVHSPISIPASIQMNLDNSNSFKRQAESQLTTNVVLGPNVNVISYADATVKNLLPAKPSLFQTTSKSSSDLSPEKLYAPVSLPANLNTTFRKTDSNSENDDSNAEGDIGTLSRGHNPNDGTLVGDKCSSDAELEESGSKEEDSVGSAMDITETSKETMISGTSSAQIPDMSSGALSLPNDSSAQNGGCAQVVAEGEDPDDFYVQCHTCLVWYDDRSAFADHFCVPCYS